MGKGSDERRVGQRAGRVRGLRDIRTFASLRGPAPVRVSLPLADIRIGLGRAERKPCLPQNREAAEQPRAWVFVKRPRFSRCQGMLLVDRIVEPEVDIFEEERSLVVLAELPGVREEEIEVRVNDDVLVLSTRSGRDDPRRYYRELLLPFVVENGGIQRAFRNGVLELELERAHSPSEAEGVKPS